MELRNVVGLTFERGFMNALILGLVLGLFWPQIHTYAQTKEIKSIEFFQENETSKLVLSLNERGVKANRFHVNEDRQIILDVEGVTATERVLRPFDTSEFSGAVVLVSPYRKPGKNNDVRIAIQLRDNVRSLLESDGDKIILTVENRFGVFSRRKIEDQATEEAKVGAGKAHDKILIPKSTNVEDILDNLTLSGTKKYIGKKVSFNVRDISISDLLEMIADSSGFNLIISDEVKTLPTLTLNLNNIPWDQALDTVLDLGKLVANKNGNILMISTLEKANSEKEKELAAKKMNEQRILLVTKIFPISFAKITDLAGLLKAYSTPERGQIATDDRTNVLIVKDTVEVIEKMRKIIETLDTQTPQILIEAKIVEASEEFAREIGMKQGMNFGYDPISPMSKIGANTGPGFAFSSAPTAGDSNRNFLSFTVGVFKRLTKLDLTLQLMESESQGKIISSPKVITENKKKAVISSTDSTSYKVTTNNGGASSESYQTADAVLSLMVTPQVTNDGSIAMEVSLTKSSFVGTRPSPEAPPNKSTKDIQTNVLVDNGSTVVIGGLYTFQKTESHTGIPFLKDLPLVGWLFRTLYNPHHTKNELIIFITPRVINQEEAGLVDREEAV